MNCVSLWQPWATLIAIEAKHWETRTWMFPTRLIGKRIAFHASKKWTRELAEICMQNHFRQALAPFCGEIASYYRSGNALPFGAIVCTGVVTRSTSAFEAFREIDERERAFGEYGPGRCAWKIEAVERFATPIPFIGRQGIFNVPDEVLRGERAA